MGDRMINQRRYGRIIACTCMILLASFVFAGCGPSMSQIKEYQDAGAIEPLIAALNDRDPDYARGALEALVKIGKPAVEPLIAALKVLSYSDQWRRWRAEEALVKIGKPAVEPLVAALQDKDQAVRCDAARVLGQIRDARAVEPLIAALQDKDQAVRREVARALCQIGDARAVEPLIVMLEDVNVRFQAIEALDKIGGDRATESIIAVLTVLKAGGVNIQHNNPDGSISVMANYTRDDQAQDSFRRRAVEALGNIGDATAIGLLEELAKKDRDKDVRQAAQKAIAKIKRK